MEISLIIIILGAIFLYKYIEEEKLHKLTGKVAYVFEEYAGCTIKGVVEDPYYNVNYEHKLYLEALLENLGISSFCINSGNYKRVKPKSLKFCETNNWINNKDKDDINKKLNSMGYFKEDRFRFHNKKQMLNFLKGIPFDQFIH